MAEDSPAANPKPTPTAEPPDSFRQDHEVMQRASMLPVSGPPSLDTLAASGGLEVPGGDPAASAALAPTPHDTRPPERFPGEREPDTLTHRESGAIGGSFNGADTPSPSPTWVDDDLALERAAEGGGARRRERRNGEHT